MVRKLILLVLSLSFVAGGMYFAFGEMDLASRTTDQNHIYAALFGGGLLGFIGVVLFLLAFRKPKPDEYETPSVEALAMGVNPMPDDRRDDYPD